MTKDEVMMMMMMVVVVMMVSFICSFNQKCATVPQVARNWNTFRSYKAVSGAFRPLLRYVEIISHLHHSSQHITYIYILILFTYHVHQCAVLGFRN